MSQQIKKAAAIRGLKESTKPIDTGGDVVTGRGERGGGGYSGLIPGKKKAPEKKKLKEPDAERRQPRRTKRLSAGLGQNR